MGLTTLEKHFRKEIDTGATNLRTRVGNFMISVIMGSDPPPGFKPITDEKVRGSLLRKLPVEGSRPAILLAPVTQRNVRLTRQKSTLFQWLAVSLWFPTGEDSVPTDSGHSVRVIAGHRQAALLRRRVPTSALTCRHEQGLRSRVSASRRGRAGYIRKQPRATAKTGPHPAALVCQSAGSEALTRLGYGRFGWGPISLLIYRLAHLGRSLVAYELSVWNL